MQHVNHPFDEKLAAPGAFGAGYWILADERASPANYFWPSEIHAAGAYGFVSFIRKDRT